MATDRGLPKTLVVPGNGVLFMDRILNWDGTYAQPADILAIAWGSYDEETGQKIESGILTPVSDYVFDSLRLDDRWRVDDQGYNFLWQPSENICPIGRRTYRVVISYAPPGKPVFSTQFRVKTYEEFLTSV